ncbi:MAG TPA: polymorphic toxin-type HINT domain-containing protein [Capsulimonadaceae bacterium]|jgi:hypothetical protein
MPSVLSFDTLWLATGTFIVIESFDKLTDQYAGSQSKPVIDQWIVAPDGVPNGTAIMAARDTQKAVHRDHEAKRLLNAGWGTSNYACLSVPVDSRGKIGSSPTEVFSTSIPSVAVQGAATVASQPDADGNVIVHLSVTGTATSGFCDVTPSSAGILSKTDIYLDSGSPLEGSSIAISGTKALDYRGLPRPYPFDGVIAGSVDIPNVSPGAHVVRIVVTDPIKGGMGEATLGFTLDAPDNDDSEDVSYTISSVVTLEGADPEPVTPEVLQAFGDAYYMSMPQFTVYLEGGDDGGKWAHVLETINSAGGTGYYVAESNTATNIAVTLSVAAGGSTESPSVTTDSARLMVAHGAGSGTTTGNSASKEFGIGIALGMGEHALSMMKEGRVTPAMVIAIGREIEGTYKLLTGSILKQYRYSILDGTVLLPSPGGEIPWSNGVWTEMAAVSSELGASDNSSIVDTLLLHKEAELRNVPIAVRRAFEQFPTVIAKAYEDAANLSPRDKGRVVGAVIDEIAAQIALDIATDGLAAPTGLLRASQASKVISRLKSIKKIRELGESSAVIGEVRAIKATCEALGTGLCFTAGTPIVTDQGAVPIERVRVGDRVLSRDQATGMQDYKTVVNTFVTHPNILYSIRYAPARAQLARSNLDCCKSTNIEDGDEDGSDGDAAITCTGNHPFFEVRRGDFVVAEDLRPGDLLRQPDGSSAVVTGRSVEVSIDSPFETYNIEVESFHTYFAGDIPVWVHNRGGVIGCDEFAKQFLIQVEKLKEAGLITNATAVTPDDKWLAFNCALQHIKTGNEWALPDSNLPSLLEAFAKRVKGHLLELSVRKYKDAVRGPSLPAGVQWGHFVLRQYMDEAKLGKEVCDAAYQNGSVIPLAIPLHTQRNTGLDWEMGVFLIKRLNAASRNQAKARLFEKSLEEQFEIWQEFWTSKGIKPLFNDPHNPGVFNPPVK